MLYEKISQSGPRSSEKWLPMFLGVLVIGLLSVALIITIINKQSIDKLQQEVQMMEIMNMQQKGGGLLGTGMNLLCFHCIWKGHDSDEGMVKYAMNHCKLDCVNMAKDLWDKLTHAKSEKEVQSAVDTSSNTNAADAGNSGENAGNNSGENNQAPPKKKKYSSDEK